MVKDRGIVYVRKKKRVWYVWFPGDKKRHACYPDPPEVWKRTKARLEKKGYTVLEIGIKELPPKGSS